MPHVYKTITRILFLLQLINTAHAMDLETQGKKLLIAAQIGDLPTCTLLVVDGANVNYADDEGRTALEFASGNGLKDVVDFLIKAQADVNHINKYDGTALAWATLKGATDVAELLILAGANINHVPRDNQTALKTASMNGNEFL